MYGVAFVVLTGVCRFKMILVVFSHFRTSAHVHKVTLGSFEMVGNFDTLGNKDREISERPCPQLKC